MKYGNSAVSRVDFMQPINSYAKFVGIQDLWKTLNKKIVLMCFLNIYLTSPSKFVQHRTSSKQENAQLPYGISIWNLWFANNKQYYDQLMIIIKFIDYNICKNLQNHGRNNVGFFS